MADKSLDVADGRLRTADANPVPSTEVGSRFRGNDTERGPDLELFRLIRECASRVAPPPELTVSEWADDRRYLSPEASAEPGRWYTSRVPYLREIMDSVNDPLVEEINIMAGAQVAKTEFELNVIGYAMDYDPCPILVVWPNIETAEAFSKDRLAPMIRDCPTLRGKVKDVASRNSGNTLRHKQFPGGHITLIGAESASGLAGRPIRLVLCDEVDRYPESAGTEGDPITLARKRTANFWNRKILLVGTPTVEGASRIASAFEDGTQEYWCLSCPSCGAYQRIMWPQIHFDSGGHVCKECGVIDSQLAWMSGDGKWIATYPERTDHRSFHLPSMVSPWVSWPKMITEFLDAKRHGPLQLKAWINTNLGETWKEKGEVPDWEKLFVRREAYQPGTIPAGGLLLTAGADVQPDRIEVEVVAWGRDKESWSVDYRVFPGSTSDVRSGAWNGLDHLLSEGYPHESGLTFHIKCLAVDTGFNTQAVYNWCRGYQPDRVIPVKGMDTIPSILGMPKAVDVYKDGRRLKKGLRLWGVGVGHLKSELYGWLRLARPEAEETTPAGFCHFPEAYEEEYFRQMCAEELVEKRLKTGRLIYEWVKIRDRNEALDCRNYARAAAAMLQIDRFQPVHWARLEEAVWGKVQSAESRVQNGEQESRGPAASAEQSYKRRGRMQLSAGVRS